MCKAFRHRMIGIMFKMSMLYWFLLNCTYLSNAFIMFLFVLVLSCYYGYIQAKWLWQIEWANTEFVNLYINSSWDDSKDNRNWGWRQIYMDKGSNSTMFSLMLSLIFLGWMTTINSCHRLISFLNSSVDKKLM